MTLLINPKYAHLHQFVAHIDETFKQHGRTIHRGRNCLKVFDIDGLSLCVKHYGDAPLHKRLMPLIHRVPKGKKAFMHPFQLRELGLESPEAVAYVSYRRSLVRHSMYFICLKSTYTHTLLEAMDFNEAEKNAVCVAFSKYLAHLHDLGFLPRELNATDVFVDKRDDRYHFALIDTNSIVRKRKIGETKGVRNFLQFFHPMPCSQEVEQAYAEARKIDTSKIMQTFDLFREGRKKMHANKKK